MFILEIIPDNNFFRLMTLESTLKIFLVPNMTILLIFVPVKLQMGI